MRHRYALVVLLLAAVAACKTPQHTELAVAKSIKTVNDLTALAVDNDIVSPDDAEVIQGFTRTATMELQRSVAARRAGQPRDVWQRALESALDALAQAQAILDGREVR